MATKQIIHRALCSFMHSRRADAEKVVIKSDRAKAVFTYFGLAELDVNEAVAGWVGTVTESDAIRLFNKANAMLDASHASDELGISDGMASRWGRLIELVDAAASKAEQDFCDEADGRAHAAFCDAAYGEAA